LREREREREREKKRLIFEKSMVIKSGYLTYITNSSLMWFNNRSNSHLSS
jgi:hypothetical protein